MPYVALPAVNRVTRRALADAHWNGMATAKPDLAAAITLQRKLIGLVDDLFGRFEAGPRPRLSLPPRYLTTKLRAGIPALTGEPIQLPVDALRPTFLELCRALAEGGGGEATLQILAAAESGQINVHSLMMLALRREQGAMRAAATRAGLGHDLLWLVADLGVSPFVHTLLDSVFGATTEPLTSALDTWARGYCPLCGSWPALAERHGDSRRLRCSLCAAAWELPGDRCLYCGESGELFAVLTPDASRPGRTIETCRGCKGYAKVLDTDTSIPFPLLALADLDSMDLDMAAMHAGFARPALKSFAARR
ncbi:MAG: formate dehydrogenase accessory protein FdhE [Vicinamibacterales bacterium]